MKQILFKNKRYYVDIETTTGVTIPDLNERGERNERTRDDVEQIVKDLKEVLYLRGAVITVSEIVKKYEIGTVAVRKPGEKTPTDSRSLVLNIYTEVVNKFKL